MARRRACHSVLVEKGNKMAKMSVLGWAGTCLAGVMLSGCQTSRPAWGRNSSTLPQRGATASAPTAPTPLAAAASGQSKPATDPNGAGVPDMTGRSASALTASNPQSTPGGNNYLGNPATGGSSFGGQGSMTTPSVFTNPSPPTPSFGNRNSPSSSIQPAGGTPPLGSAGQPSFTTTPSTNNVPTMPSPSLRTPEE
jgi:hypothetical protein